VRGDKVMESDGRFVGSTVGLMGGGPVMVPHGLSAGRMPGTLSVEGFGRVSGPPDTFRVVYSYWSEAADGAAALARLDERVGEIQERASHVRYGVGVALGVECREVAAGRGKIPRKPATRATRTESLTVNRPEDAAALCKALAACGCDVLSVESSCSDEADMRSSAVKSAAKDAYDKAQASLAWASARLGEPLSVRVRDGRPLTGQFHAFPTEDDDEAAAKFLSGLRMERRVEASVEVVYELLPGAGPPVDHDEALRRLAVEPELPGTSP
jgi:uncharacterized protein YggE